MPTPSHSKARTALLAAAKERILILDGAMGTMIQGLKLDEEGYRGARFDAWNREVRGNNDLLNLSRPDAIRDIHLAYFRAGADVVVRAVERLSKGGTHVVADERGEGVLSDVLVVVG